MKEKKYSPWMVLFTPENKKVFIKKDNVLSVSRGGHHNLTMVLYINDYRGKRKEVCVGVVESLKEIFWKLQW